MLCKLFFGEIFFFCTEIVYGEKIFFYMSKGSLRSRRRGEGACKRRNRGEAFRPAAVSALLSAALYVSVCFLSAYTIPCASIASTTFSKPAMFAPTT